MIPTEMKHAPHPPTADLPAPNEAGAAAGERPSKTQQKKAMHALQALGEELVALSKEQLAQVPLEDGLREAIEEAQRIRSHEGRRRQLQYIGRLMRDTDPAPLRAVLDVWKGKSAAANAQLHALERWRERLLAHDEALTELVAAHPGADAQRLRTLIRNARREHAENRPPKAYRELFQVLKPLIES